MVEPDEPRDAEDRHALLEREPQHPEARVERQRGQRERGRRHEGQAGPAVGALAAGHRRPPSMYSSRRRGVVAAPAAAS